MNKSLDALICAVPFTDTSSPLVGPALLKAYAQDNGFSVKCIDFNVDLWNLSQDPSSKYFGKYSKFQFSKDKDPELAYLWKRIVRKWAEEMVQTKARHIGFCAFSFLSEQPILDLCKEIRKLSDQKILIGGPAAQSVGKAAYESQLCDYYVCGDGEKALVAILNGDSDFPGLNQTKSLPMVPIQTTPIPDYSDYDLTKYAPKFGGSNGCDQLYITASRGCVRNCSFCDVANLWDKYQFQSADKTITEMVSLNDKYGINNFYFTDSLVNGATKNLRAQCEGLIEYYKETGKKPFGWRGYAIIRPEKSMKPEMFDLMKESGCYLLSLGIESGSEKVRKLMNKKYLNSELDYTMEQLDRVGIRAVMLTMVGHPGETEEDFQETIKVFEKYAKYAQKGNVEVVAISILMFLNGTPLLSKYDHIDTSTMERIKWEIDGLTFKERYRRFNVLKKRCRELGYIVPDTEIEQFWERALEEERQQLLDEAKNTRDTQLTYAGV